MYAQLQVGALQVSHIGLELRHIDLEFGNVLLDVVQSRRHAKKLVGQEGAQQQPLSIRVGPQLRDYPCYQGFRIKLFGQTLSHHLCPAQQQPNAIRGRGQELPIFACHCVLEVALRQCVQTPDRWLLVMRQEAHDGHTAAGSTDAGVRLPLGGGRRSAPTPRPGGRQFRHRSALSRCGTAWRVAVGALLATLPEPLFGQFGYSLNRCHLRILQPLHRRCRAARSAQLFLVRMPPASAAATAARRPASTGAQAARTAAPGACCSPSVAPWRSWM